MKIAGKLFMTCYRIIAFIIVAVAALMAVLFILGIRPYAVRTGSMEPSIHKGSLCFINHRTPYEDVSVGQVIAFKMGDTLVTHRVVRIDSEGITTKGDANNVSDAKKVTKDNYIGKNEAVVPFFGKLPLFAHSASGKVVFFGCLAAFLLSGLLYDRISKWIEKKENSAAEAGGNDNAQ